MHASKKSAANPGSRLGGMGRLLGGDGCVRAVGKFGEVARQPIFCFSVPLRKPRTEEAAYRWPFAVAGVRRRVAFSVGPGSRLSWYRARASRLPWPALRVGFLREVG
jgi:hypothetical protein